MPQIEKREHKSDLRRGERKCPMRTENASVTEGIPSRKTKSLKLKIKVLLTSKKGRKDPKNSQTGRGKGASFKGKKSAELWPKKKEGAADKSTSTPSPEKKELIMRGLASNKKAAQ